ncbi:hypothetical protein EV130_101665 [Rhizobium azibense]|uniref:Uncharacterized protein n=1 Tax=Rhizobium azibense TaxID=1136135 RepID=A0A4R3R7B6_9HYPH|nr:hypothetical protein EV130_101665 [Rhizobium azibense]TCU40887.1 hypothetical protein EV129_101173 [Rhizobium azibense]
MPTRTRPARRIDRQSRVAKCWLWSYIETAAACTFSSRCRQLFPSGGSHLHISWAAITCGPFFRQSSSMTGKPSIVEWLFLPCRKLHERGRQGDERWFGRWDSSVQVSSRPLATLSAGIQFMRGEPVASEPQKVNLRHLETLSGAAAQAVAHPCKAKSATVPVMTMPKMKYSSHLRQTPEPPCRKNAPQAAGH